MGKQAQQGTLYKIAVFCIAEPSFIFGGSPGLSMSRPG